MRVANTADVGQSAERFNLDCWIMGEMVHANGQDLEDKLSIHKTKGNHFIHYKD